MENLKSTQTEELKLSTKKSIDDSELPVLKVNNQGRILYANAASIKILNEILHPNDEYLPEYFLKLNPDILNPNADFSLRMKTKSHNFNFDVIGFRESGYIGIYCHSN